LLTNYLKEVVSYRQWNMMDEFKLMDQVKQELCFVSTDFIGDLAATRKSSKSLSQARGESNSSNTSSMDIEPSKALSFIDPLKKYFALPDFQKVLRGYVLPENTPIGPDDQVSIL
jgi:hypothetical protein